MGSSRSPKPSSCSRVGTPAPKEPKGWGPLHLQGMPFDGGAAPDLLIGAVDPVVPGICLAPGHCNHLDTLEAIPVNPWAEGQRPVPAGAAHVPALGTTA